MLFLVEIWIQYTIAHTDGQEKSTGISLCFFVLAGSDSAGNFARTEAMSAHIDVLRGAVDDRLHALHVGLPGTIGAAVGVGHLNAEHDALVTKFTFSHSLEPPRWFMTPLSGASPGRCVIT